MTFAIKRAALIIKMREYARDGEAREKIERHMYAEHLLAVTEAAKDAAAWDTDRETSLAELESAEAALRKFSRNTREYTPSYNQFICEIVTAQRFADGAPTRRRGRKADDKTARAVDAALPIYESLTGKRATRSLKLNGFGAFLADILPILTIMSNPEKAAREALTRRSTAKIQQK